MNVGTNDRDHPNSSPISSPSPRQHGATMLNDTYGKQASLVWQNLDKTNISACIIVVYWAIVCICVCVCVVYKARGLSKFQLLQCTISALLCTCI